jgi:hypothetical protein
MISSPRAKGKMPVIPADYEEFIDSIRWDELDDAYGNSSKVYKSEYSPADVYGPESLPTLLKQLCSDDEDLRQDAVNDGIWSRAYHQGTLYPATPYAAKALLILLKSRSIAEMHCGNGGPTYFEIFKFLDWCGQRYRHKPAEQPFLYLSAAVSENIDTIRSYGTDPDPAVRLMVESLIDSVNSVLKFR